METRLAATFIKVAELGNITKAAEQLGYSQGTVTSQIKQLEDNLGILLFDRVGRGIQLTDAGRKFVDYATRLVRASEDADAFAMDESDPEGHLIIETTSSVSIGIMSRYLAGFRLRYPKISVSVRLSEDTDVLINHVRQNRVDFSILLGPLDIYENCDVAVTKEDEFRFITSPSDRLAKKKNVSLDEVLDESFVSAFLS